MLTRTALVVGGKKRQWGSFAVVGLVLVALFAVAVASVLPSSLFARAENWRLGVQQDAPFALTPAAAEPVAERITFGDLGATAEQFPPEGDFYFVTVTNPAQSVLSWLLGRHDPAITFITHEDKFGLRTPSQRRVFAQEQMRSSEQVAQYVALDRLGYDVELTPGDVLIEDFVCLEANAEGTECVKWSPSEGTLDPGDRILSVEGTELASVEDLVDVLAGRRPGDVVNMRIDRPDLGVIEVDVTLTAAPDEPDRTIVGFFPYDTRQVKLPFELDINTGAIGGPSAGLAFTLTLIDELSSGELTGGRNIAITGTIELDGSVGEIGGLRQKASAVAQAGVDVFLVPTSQGEDDIAAARAAGGDRLEVIAVDTLDEALEVLLALGGDPIPAAPAASDSDG